MANKRTVALVHQGIWDMTKYSMPLALGYLKAYAMADPGLAEALEFRIHNYRGPDRPIRMVPEVLLDDTPEILACSVFGWNFRNFGQLAETFAQIKPSGWTIFGGTHVSHQAERVFKLYPAVDVVVNGEGEKPFRALLRAILDGRAKHELHDIKGISFRDEHGTLVTTAAEARIRDLDEIPSPFLTGAMPMLDADGEFLYDVVTMETNRGCPYQCAFCYWGGATGQKIHSFSQERLKSELALFGALGVENIALADANYGMLPADREFLLDFLDVRAKHGYPRALTVSWAKNKGKVFYDMVKTMKATGLQADFTLAIQTLEPAALESSRRKNMKLNDFEDLCQWLHREGLESYAEMIWGLPGETYDSFLAGYDRVAQYVSRIATYTNLLLPNTTYDRERVEHGFVTIRGQDYDYEYILAHNTMTLADNRRMHEFMFWARVMAEHMFLNYIWDSARLFCGMTQSRVLLSMAQWFQRREEPLAVALREIQTYIVEKLDMTRVYQAVRFLYQSPEIDDLLRAWWREEVVQHAEPQHHEYLTDLLEYDFLARPIHDDVAAAKGMEVEVIRGERFYVRREVRLGQDIGAILEQLVHTSAYQEIRSTEAKDLYYRAGFEKYIDNHEIVSQYGAKTRTQLDNEARLREEGLVATEKARHVVGLPAERTEPGAKLTVVRQ